MPIEWIEYKGHRILYSDYRGMSEGEMKDQLRSEQKLIMGYPEPVLLIHNIEGLSVNKELVQAVKDQQVAIKDNVAKSAVLGITGMLSVILAVINSLTGKEMKSFESEEEALEWLVME